MATQASASVSVSPSKKAWETIRARQNSGYYEQKAKLDEKKAQKAEQLASKKLAPIKLPKPVKASTAQMLHRTVVLVLTFSGIGNRRQERSVELKTSADREWLGVTKKLFDAEELTKITSLDGEARRYIETRALPSLIKNGVYLLPVELVEEVDARLSEYQNKRQPLVESLVANLKPLIADAKKRLKDLFDESEYPSAAQIRASFDLRWRFVYVDSAKNLQNINAEIYERERRKAEKEWEETRTTIQQLLRTNLSEMVAHMIDKLTPDEKGSRKIFRDSSVAKLQDFLGTFDVRNITNDVELKALVDRAKQIVQDADPELLRTNEATRDYVKNGFEQIKKLLDPMVIVKPKRAIHFDNV